MGTNHYLVDHAGRRALDCGLWPGLSRQSRGGTVTRERLDRAWQQGESPQLLRVAKSWLAGRGSAEVVLVTTQPPWRDAAGQWCGGSWVVDDPWAYGPKGPPWGHLKYPFGVLG